MNGNFSQHKGSFVYYDNVAAGTLACTAWGPVSLASAAEVATANTAHGTSFIWGDIVVPTPVQTVNGIVTGARQVVGVLAESNFSGKEVTCIVGGMSWVLVNAACTTGDGKLVHPAAITTRTDAQTPFTDAPELKIAFDPRAALSYNVATGFCPTITPAVAFPLNTYNPIGWLREEGLAQYNIIAVDLDFRPVKL